VLCEKPLAISVAEGKEMLRAAEDNRTLLLPAFKFRFFDEIQKAKELIDRNSLGKILSFRVMFGGLIDMTGTWYAQKNLAGGGVIMDNGPHALDIVRYLLGEIRNVTAYGSHFQKLEVEDTAQLSLSLESGAMGTADLSWSNSMPSVNYLEIYGEDGNIFLSAEGMNYKFKTWKEWKKVPRERGPRELFALQVDHFLQCIAGMPPKQVTGDDGLKSQILIEAAYESIRREAKIAVSAGERVPEPSTAAYR
jgi:predicted dehydrogenase